MEIVSFEEEKAVVFDKSSLVINKESSFGEHKVRYGILSNGDETQSWFVMNDVCQCLGIKRTWHVRKRIEAYFPDDVCLAGVVDSNGRTRQTTCISENQVYTNIIAKSTKPEAIRLQKWVGMVIRKVRSNLRFQMKKQNEELSITLQMKQLAIEDAKDENDRHMRCRAKHRDEVAALKKQIKKIKWLGVKEPEKDTRPPTRHDFMHADCACKGCTAPKRPGFPSRTCIQKFQWYTVKTKDPIDFQPDTHWFKGDAPAAWSSPSVNKSTGCFMGATDCPEVETECFVNIDGPFVEPL